LDLGLLHYVREVEGKLNKRKTFKRRRRKLQNQTEKQRDLTGSGGKLMLYVVPKVIS